MPVPFVLLVLALCAVWLPPRITRGLPVWALVHAAAVAAAVMQGIVQPPGLVALVALWGLALTVGRSTGRAVRLTASLLLAVLALALALHRIPGFQNPVAIDGLVLSTGARPFTQYLNFDKASAGLVLLTVLAPRWRPGDAIGRPVRTTLLACTATGVAVFGVALVAGWLQVDPKLPQAAALFLATNLFFTCIAEETFFRVLVQDPLSGLRPGARQHMTAGSTWRQGLAAGASALLFGLAHAGGGVALVVLATLTGLGCAIVYAATRRIEAPIAVHFGVNAVHFLVFTYPL